MMAVLGFAIYIWLWPLCDDDEMTMDEPDDEAYTRTAAHSIQVLA